MRRHFHQKSESFEGIMKTQWASKDYFALFHQRKNKYTVFVCVCVKKNKRALWNSMESIKSIVKKLALEFIVSMKKNKNQQRQILSFLCSRLVGKRSRNNWFDIAKNFRWASNAFNKIFINIRHKNEITFDEQRASILYKAIPLSSFRSNVRTTKRNSILVIIISLVFRFSIISWHFFVCLFQPCSASLFAIASLSHFIQFTLTIKHFFVAN